jgi:hypothetical protein
MTSSFILCPHPGRVFRHSLLPSMTLPSVYSIVIMSSMTPDFPSNIIQFFGIVFLTIYYHPRRRHRQYRVVFILHLSSEASYSLFTISFSLESVKQNLYNIHVNTSLLYFINCFLYPSSAVPFCPSGL